MQVSARVEAGASAPTLPQLLLDLVMRPRRIVANQVVKNAHIAIHSL